MRRSWVRGAVGATVLAPALLVALAPSPAPPAASGAAVLPDRLAGYSHLTGDVSAAPPGRAVALFQHGFGVEFLDFPQAVVIGADGELARRLDVAESRAGGVVQGDPAPMLLSPDGTRVAVGVHSGSDPDLLLVDLTDGGVDRHAVPGGQSTLPVAWSPDGRRLAYLSGREATNPYSGEAISGDVGILDLGTGRTAPLPGAEDAVVAAFSPDGARLAVQHGAAEGGGLEILPLDGTGGRTLALPAGYRLDGPDAWSPDGGLLAVARAGTACPAADQLPVCGGSGAAVDRALAFVDAGGGAGTVPPRLEREVVGDGRVLGWSAEDRVLVLVPEPPYEVGDPDRHWITEVPLEGGAPRRLAAVPTDDGSYGVGRFQLAAGLLADLEVREATGVDRGRWPLWLRVGAALAAAAASALLAPALLRRRAR